jgi:PAS domain S-box-containing protein
MPLPERLWEPSNRVPVLLASAMAIILIAFADWLTKPYVSLGFLYLFPIMLVAGFLPRRALLALGMFCAALSEAFSSLDPAWRVSRFCFEALALTGSGLFVSELLRNRKLNQKTRQRLHAMVETSPAAIVMLDEKGTIHLANHAASEVFGLNQTDICGQPIVRFLPDLGNAVRTEEGPQLRASMQCTGYRASGDAFVAEVWFSTWKERGAPKLAAIIADVTENQPAAIDSFQTASGVAERVAFGKRQMEVLRLVFQGLSNRQIASHLEITTNSVRNTLQQIFCKIGVNNRSQLVRVALERYRDLL